MAVPDRVQPLFFVGYVFYPETMPAAYAAGMSRVHVPAPLYYSCIYNDIDKKWRYIYGYDMSDVTGKLCPV